jgi:hypothetical protein
MREMQMIVIVIVVMLLGLQPGKRKHQGEHNQQ